MAWPPFSMIQALVPDSARGMLCPIRLEEEEGPQSEGTGGREGCRSSTWEVDLQPPEPDSHCSARTPGLGPDPPTNAILVVSALALAVA